ncbi:hypothetical protein AgCh_024325 [Apium graveolens]
MSGDKAQFLSLQMKKGGRVTIGDSKTLQILGKGKIGNKHISIDKVQYVKGLKYNLLSISQLYDDGHTVNFGIDKCIIAIGTNKVPLVARREGNIYILDFELQKTACCLAAIDTDPYVWHRRLGHAHMDLLNKLSKKKLVRGLPKIKYVKTEVCSACQLGKQIRSTHKAKKMVSTSKPLELLHLDLFGPEAYKSIGGKQYGFVIIDDYSRFTWVLFLRTKDTAFNEFEKLIKLLENKLNTKLVGIRSDRGGEFQKDFVTYCEERGISHEFSAPRTPQQNGVVERKNRSLQETSRTLLQESKLPRIFWAEAVNTACYVLNRVLIRRILDKTPYELLKKKKPNISYFRIFGSKCFVLKTIGNDGKFDAKSYEAIFLGYSMNSKTYRVYNLSKHIVEEFIDVTFQEPNNDLSRDEEDDAGNQQAEPSTPVDDAIVKMAKMTLDGPRGNRAKDKMPIYDEQVIGDISDGLKTRKGTANFCAYAAFLAQEEPKNVKEALEDENWITAMQEELNQFERCDVWELVKPPKDASIIVARLESIRMLLAYACDKKIKLHQMDVKSVFLNGFLEESKSTPMNQNSKLTSDEKGKDVDIKKYRGMIGSLLYLTASRPDIMYSVCVCARFQAKPKESHLNAVKRIFRYLRGTIILGLLYPITSTFDLVGYSDADYAGCQTDRKSTSGVCTYLGQSLVSWQSKKQTSVALSTAEGEYLAAGSCCSQILWMIQTLRDFGIKCGKVPIYCDNTSTINISKNPVNHSRTKYIDVRHHFLRDNAAKGKIELVFVPTEYQLAYIFTKSLGEARFSTIRRELGMCSV